MQPDQGMIRIAFVQLVDCLFGPGSVVTRTPLCLDRLLQQGHERGARELAGLAVGKVRLTHVGVQEIGAAQIGTG